MFSITDSIARSVLITGGAGLLGRHLIEGAPDWAEVSATQRRGIVRAARPITVDLTNARQVAVTFDEVRPELVIHTAYRMGHKDDIVSATGNVADACRATGAGLIHISTDALFDGLHAPYSESDSPSPITDYGRWKAEAEDVVTRRVPDVAIVRTTLITQITRSEPLDSRSAWVANALRHGQPITLFLDELRCPISPQDLAAQIWEVAGLSSAERQGVWHLAGPEALSRYTLGLLIAVREGLDPTGITMAHTDPTVRPRDLRLSMGRAERQLQRRARPIAATLLDGPAGVDGN